MIDLNINNGYSWFSYSETFIKGYFFFEDKFYEEDKAVELISSYTIEQLRSKIIQQLNGSFTIIKKEKNQILLANNFVRTFPLFYYYNNTEWNITDDITPLYPNRKYDKNALQEFSCSGMVIGDKTLFEDVFQVQSGEYVLLNLDSNKLSKEIYSDYLYEPDFKSISYTKMQAIGMEIFDKVEKRLIGSLNGRQVVLPLSGGYDSRLIACIMKKHNYTNVICFTYGDRDDSEVSMSKKVASILGLKWFFVDYNDDLFRQFTSDNKIVQGYASLGFNFTSLAHFQDFYAVYYLKSKRIIEENAIFIPGHSADLLRGDHRPLIYPSIQKIKKYIRRRHLEYEYKKLNIGLQGNSSNYEYNMSLYDNWDIKERQSKFIVNSLRVYEYFGYQHRIPLWDSELKNFFKNVPHKYKKTNDLFSQTIFKRYFELFQVDYRKTKKSNLDRLKSYLDFYLPKNILKLLSRFKAVNKTSMYRLYKQVGGDVESTNNINRFIMNYFYNRYNL